MNPHNIEMLNKQFNLDGQLSFLEVADELILIKFSNTHGRGSLTLQGAQLLGWEPWDQEPLIWLSAKAKYQKGKAIRGGIPICWPWFGNVESNSDLPAHGFARNSLWQMKSVEQLPDDAICISLQLMQSEASLKLWPYRCELTISYMFGKNLEIELVSSNLDQSDIELTEAFHTYFHVSHIEHIRIDGLDSVQYIDKLDQGKIKQQNGSIVFNGETDRVYLNTLNKCYIDDPGFKRRIGIEKSGSLSTVIWNPWVEKAKKLGDMDINGYRDMVCVESGNMASNSITLKPGEQHKLHTIYSIETL